MSARIEDRGDRLVVVNANATRRNALTPAYYDALHDALAQAAASPRVTSVILTGEGGFFCAGGDLTALATRRDLPEAARRERIEALHDLIRAIRACPVPVIAAVDGGAAGAGVSLAFACDLVVAAEDARFTIAYVKAGLTPDGGITWTLARHLPPALLARLALTGEPITAPRLDALGALSALSAPGEALAAAHDLADRLAAGPGATQRTIKALLHRAGAATLDAQLDAERDAMARAQGSAEAAEGIGAFLDKRSPDFTRLRDEI